MTEGIRTEALSKSFPAQQGWQGLLRPGVLGPPALDRVDLEVRAGELFGLVGPNGAGKTTLIKLLATLGVPTSGQAWVGGHPLTEPRAIKRILGLVTSDERSFYWRLTGRQNLAFFAALQAVPEAEISHRVGETLELLDLAQVADQRFLTYSTGIRQRLSIARALLHRPRLLFLDEPTKGLDPNVTRQLHTLVRDELTRDQGLTVFLTTHFLTEAETLCDRIAVLHKGRIRACGTLDELRTGSGLAAAVQLQVRNLHEGFAAELSKPLPVFQITPNGDQGTTFSFQEPQDPAQLDHLIDLVRSSGGRIVSLTRTPASLETIFANLTAPTALPPDPQPLPGPATLTKPSLSRQPGSKPVPPERRTTSDRPASGQTTPVESPRLRLVMAFLRRDWLNEISYRFSFVLQFFGVFFSVAVYHFVAELFGDAAAAFLAPYGGDYFSFVLIGIAFSGYFGVGLSGFSSSLRQAQTTGTLEAMLTTPTRVSTIIINSSLWDYAFTTLRVLIFLFVGAVFLDVDLSGGNYPAAFLILILTIIAFSGLGILAASFIMVLKRGDPVTWVLNALATLLGGVYYPITVLPDWLQILSRLIPVTYALRAMRLALLQGASFAALLPDILALALFGALFLPLSLVAFRYAVQRARIDGSLTHY